METVFLSDNIRIAYRKISGDADKPVLLFLHEGLGCVEMWRDFPQTLCRLTGCAGIVYDRQGYGHSSPLDTERTVHYLHTYAHRELPLIIEALIPGRPFVIIGHSDGGSIGLLYASNRPTELKGLVTMASHVYVDDLTLSGIQAAQDAYAAGKLRALERYHGQKTGEMFRAWSQTWLSRWFRSWRIEYALPSIECPVLVVQGKQDQYGSADQVSAIARGIGECVQERLVDKCGHAPHLDQPQVMLDLLKEFLLNSVGIG